MLDPVAVLAAIGTILSSVVAAGIKRVWVWGYQLADMEEDRDFWRDTALRSLSNADKAIDKLPKPDA